MPQVPENYIGSARALSEFLLGMVESIWPFIHPVKTIFNFEFDSNLTHGREGESPSLALQVLS